MAGAKVEGCPVADAGAAGAPDAAGGLVDAGVVDVVLGGGALVLPGVVGGLVDGGQGGGGAGADNGGEDHVFSAGVVGAADGDLLVELGDDDGGVDTPLAEVFRGRVGAVELAALAEEATDGDTVGGLVAGPLGLGHAGLAGVGAVGAFGAGAEGGGAGLVEAGPAAESKVV